MDEAGTARCMSRLALCMRPVLPDTGPGCLRHTHGLTAGWFHYTSWAHIPRRLSPSHVGVDVSRVRQGYYAGLSIGVGRRHLHRRRRRSWR